MNAQSYDALIVGAGFAGTFMLYRLRQQGLRAKVLEAADGPGGTWYWNRYPGARCDIESMEYSYQFSEALQQEWEWSERYATQPEILQYINTVVDRFDLRSDMQFNTRVASAQFDDAQKRWTLTSTEGEVFDAKFVVMATGCLSSANLPQFEGLESFAGDWYHTGHWPHEPVDFSGKKVAVIGTGSSAIQSIPLIAEQAAQLTVFQRSANYSVPAHNQPLDPRKVAEIKSSYGQFRQANSETAFHADFGYNEANALDVTAQERQQEYEARWARGGLPFMAAFADLLFVPEANDTAADFLRGKIRGIVEDPETAERLLPSSVVGCKRLCVDTNYFATYNRDNVRLVDVSENQIQRLTVTGLETQDQSYAFDAIVFATGFDAMTGALTKIDIRGEGGRRLIDAWSEGPKTYLGLSVAGFPNLFTVTGPGSPSVLTNMLPSIEHHVNWIADCIRYVNEQGVRAIDATTDAQDQWVAHVNEVGDTSLYPRCNSWYLGANIPGKPRVFMPYLGFPPYAEKCQEVAEHGYQGYALRS
ncbi:MAG: flavin-containing monooxygenase [Pseudomonadales bacterium]